MGPALRQGVTSPLLKVQRLFLSRGIEAHYTFSLECYDRNTLICNDLCAPQERSFSLRLLLLPLCISQSSQELNKIVKVCPICVQHHAVILVRLTLSHLRMQTRLWLAFSLNVGMQQMEDLVNTLSFQCQNKVPCWVVWFGMAAEVVVRGEEREKPSSWHRHSCWCCLVSSPPNGKRTLFFALKQPIFYT